MLQCSIASWCTYHAALDVLDGEDQTDDVTSRISMTWWHLSWVACSQISTAYCFVHCSRAAVKKHRQFELQVLTTRLQELWAPCLRMSPGHGDLHSSTWSWPPSQEKIEPGCIQNVEIVRNRSSKWSKNRLYIHHRASILPGPSQKHPIGLSSVLVYLETNRNDDAVKISHWELDLDGVVNVADRWVTSIGRKASTSSRLVCGATSQMSFSRTAWRLAGIFAEDNA